MPPSCAAAAPGKLESSTVLTDSITRSSSTESVSCYGTDTARSALSTAALMMLPIAVPSALVVLQDTRGDRQPSFTQMDLEMTFSDQDVIMKLAEDLMRTIFQEVSFRCLCLQL